MSACVRFVRACVWCARAIGEPIEGEVERLDGALRVVERLDQRLQVAVADGAVAQLHALQPAKGGWLLGRGALRQQTGA
eukprot:6068760-Pleurochrysis_carterae.AAC.1